MESSSSNSVNPTPAWQSGSRSNTAPAADPMAFFDLIMKSSQAMSAKGGKSLDPIASTGATSAANDPYTATTDDPNLHDGYDDSPSAYAPEVHSRPSSDTEQATDSSGQQDNAAAVAEFSEQQSVGQEEEDGPDEAALETAAAASQQDQLLAAPDTLAEEGKTETVQPSSEEVTATAKDKKDLPLQGKVDTDQPLDTTESSEDRSQEKQHATAEVTAETNQPEQKQADDSEFAVANDEVAIEAAETNATDEANKIHSQEKGKIELEADQQVTEESIDTDIHLESEDAAQEDASDRQPKNRKTQSVDNKNAKPVDVVEPTPSATPDVSTVAAVSKASEALAAAASGGNASTATSSGSTPTANTNGVNNLASLLQRGFQKGTLQKAENSQAPKLDPKQQIRLVNRVARAVESTPPGQSIKIRLNPSELGQLKVEIKIENGNMTAKIEAENAATRQVLLENLPQLRERLAESNINVQQFEVELMGQQTPQDGSASTFADQSGEQGGSQTPGRQGMKANGEEEPAPDKRETVNKDAELNSRNLNITI